MNEDFIDRLSALAHLETIRSSRIEPLKLQINKKGSLSETNETIKLPRLTHGRIHIITNISLVCIGTGTPQVFLGLLSKGEKYHVYSSTVTTAENSVTWAGQIIALEFDEIFALLQGATATDEAILTAFGYSMRL